MPRCNHLPVWVLCIALVGCESHGDKHRVYQAAPEFGGVITVAISEPQGQKYSNYIFEVRPSAGRTDLVKQAVTESAELQVDAASTGHISCSSSPRLPSPNGKFVVRCEGPAPGSLSMNEHDYVIFEDRTEHQLQRNGIWHVLRVVGFAWSPDSKSVAVLCASTTPSDRPVDLLARATGSAVPDFDYNLELFSVENDSVSRHLPYIRANSRYGFGAITSWKSGK